MTKIKYLLCFCATICLALANPAVIDQSEDEFLPFDGSEQYDNELDKDIELDSLKNNYEIDMGYAVSSEEDDDPYLRPSDVPGCSYANTPQKLQAMGIQTNRVDPGILEDSFLLVVCGSVVVFWWIFFF